MARSRRGWFVICVLVVVPVAVTLWWVLVPNWQARAITAVVGSSESPTVEVTVAHEDCGTGPPRVEVSEDADTIVLLAAYDEGHRGCNDEGQLSTVVAELDAPLGNRTVEVRTLGGDVACDIAGDDLRRCIEP